LAEHTKQDKVVTRLGTLNFFDGLPDKASAEIFTTLISSTLCRRTRTTHAGKYMKGEELL